MELRYAPLSAFQAVRAAELAPDVRSGLFAALCRINVLYMVKRAGSGHLGTSFSCQDLVSWIFLEETRSDSDIFFSSKGHDVPAFYAALSGLEQLPFEKIHALRRLGGLPGHPEVHIPRLEANTGSLGMGISKGKGMLLARRQAGTPARVFVLTGDGEMEEGQIWESLASAVATRMDELTVIVDHNKIQSDTWVHKVSAIGDLVAKFQAFGWHVVRVDGHDLAAMARTFGALRDVRGQPKVVIADTVKGKGVSFMEAFGPDDKFYDFHSGAPSDERYTLAAEELVAEARARFAAAGIPWTALETYEHVVPPSSTAPRQMLVGAYGRELVKQAARNPRIVALDADLIKDCGLAQFAEQFPERLVECGIAEQDMVGQAGGLAIKGMLPIVHSFSSFLSARPNEQIYTNGTEATKIIYTATLAGLLPATPGHSHQSVRDISSLAAVPNLVMIAPSTEAEVAAALAWAIEGTRESTYLRLCSIPCVLPYEPDPAPMLTLGVGSTLREGRDVAIVAYGPVMLAQAYGAAQRLETEGIGLRVINLPWLNRVDAAWFAGAVAGVRTLFTLDDHYVRGGQGEMLLASLAEHGWPDKLRAVRLGLHDVPACGHNDEVLAHHGFDEVGLARTIRRYLGTSDS
jgi:transketolase